MINKKNYIAHKVNMVDTFYYYFISDWCGSRLNDTLDLIDKQTSIHVNAQNKNDWCALL
jgi:hypothetical protein